jgi:hypothetical protein
VHLGIDPAQVLQELGGQLTAGLRDGAGRGDLVQDTGGVRRGDPLGNTAGDQLAQHRMEPAHDLGPGPPQVPVPLGPHRQHRGVVIGPDRPAAG